MNFVQRFHGKKAAAFNKSTVRKKGAKKKFGKGNLANLTAS